MRYETAAAFRTALEERLKAYAREHDAPIVRMRKMVTFDRLLARLMAGSPDSWVLKGAMALSYRYGDRSRTTMDLDLAREDDEDAAQADLMRSLRRELDDFFVFRAERVGPSADPGVRSTRYRAVAELAGRQFETIRIDIGFGDSLMAEPEMIHTSTLLEFAGMEPVRVPALPVEQHIAEKVHAYSRSYRPGRVSSRSKDLADLLLIASLDRPQAERLKAAFTGVFGARGSHAMPDHLPAPPESWRIPYRELAANLGLEPDLKLAHGRAGLFLDPVLAYAAVGTWNPDRWAWERVAELEE
ncbi:MAG: nucleotidyl transferase AbiEii/AbiGii toxin family protein [Vicinamibacteria bacterium]